MAAIAESGRRENLSRVARCANVSRPVIYSGLSDLYEGAPGVKAINLKGDAFHPEWNYTISP